MKRVDVAKFRDRSDYIGVCGHRLKGHKRKWHVAYPGALGGDCPTCSDKPEPCDDACHTTPGYRWAFCPWCGVALPTKQEG